MTDAELIRRCDVLEILDNEGSLGRTRKLVEQLAAITTEAQAAEIERLRDALREVNMMINAEDQTFAERLMRASLFTRSALTGAKT